jgi:hypothetical protein
VIAQSEEPAENLKTWFEFEPGFRAPRALREINDAVASELLDTIGHSTPQFFEILVLDLLHAMGYGVSRTDLQHVGKSGDGGIDGIISLDRLGLEKVCVQPKRWQQSIDRPDIRGFYGALAAPLKLPEQREPRLQQCRPFRRVHAAAPLKRVAQRTHKNGLRVRLTAAPIPGARRSRNGTRARLWDRAARSVARPRRPWLVPWRSVP